MERLYDESTGRDKKLSRDDWAHGSLLVTIELLRCCNVAGEVNLYVLFASLSCWINNNMNRSNTYTKLDFLFSTIINNNNI